MRSGRNMSVARDTLTLTCSLSGATPLSYQSGRVRRQWATPWSIECPLPPRLARDVVPHPGMRYASGVIRSFGDRETELLFGDQFVRKFQGVARRAKRKLELLHATARLDDLAVPPSNRLEKLRGDLQDFYSVRINDQWRVIFMWRDGDAHEVAIVDYH